MIKIVLENPAAVVLVSAKFRFAAPSPTVVEFDLLNLQNSPELFSFETIKF